ncbi:hypothetical protein [Paraburkholderia kururiensis]|uniref:hypothetical protein n=1 Tax=Paraburkholderia kururiensis TaxID=984307 RepID=UPI0003457288|nr:hypothetical protein [Paraburkholderia kururiensis]
MKTRNFNGRLVETGTDLDTEAEKVERRARGGAKKLNSEQVEQIWDEVQLRTREGLGWKAHS